MDRAFDLIKVSAAQAGCLLDEYQILSCGGALGLNCGPLLISKELINFESVPEYRVYLPGKDTTAKLLFDFAFPNAKKQHYLLFSEIENKVLADEHSLGVIIHENRFTYLDKGLKCLMDLGQNWFEQTGLPIPLGVIMVRKSLSPSVKQDIKESIQCSIKLANSNPEVIWPYIKKHASEMDDKVIKNHIGLYVNHFSTELEKEGKEAIQYLLRLQGYPLETSELFF